MFCDKAVEGGIKDCPLDEVPDIIGLVVAALQESMEAINKAIVMAKLLGDVDRFFGFGRGRG